MALERFSERFALDILTQAQFGPGYVVRKDGRARYVALAIMMNAGMELTVTVHRLWPHLS